MPSGESTFGRNDGNSFLVIEGCTVVICDGFLVNSPISKLAINLLVQIVNGLTSLWQICLFRFTGYQINRQYI